MSENKLLKKNQNNVIKLSIKYKKLVLKKTSCQLEGH